MMEMDFIEHAVRAVRCVCMIVIVFITITIMITIIKISSAHNLFFAKCDFQRKVATINE